MAEGKSETRVLPRPPVRQDAMNVVTKRRKRHNFAAIVRVSQNAMCKYGFCNLPKLPGENRNDCCLNRLPRNQHFVFPDEHINL
jgi:hypothetical protein